MNIFLIVYIMYIFLYSIKKYTSFLEGCCSCCRMCGQAVSFLVLPSLLTASVLGRFWIHLISFFSSTNFAFDSCEGTNYFNSPQTLALTPHGFHGFNVITAICSSKGLHLPLYNMQQTKLFMTI